MDVSFASKKLQKTCSTEAGMKKKLGASRAKRLMQRLAELDAADTLDDISHLPPARCHELTNDRNGQLSVDLDHPYRLIFKPDHLPPPAKPDGGLDWKQVTKVLILEICDTHE